MAVEVKLPRLGQGMESGTIVRWLKSEGDEVAKGEPLYELDTDKVTQEVEADAAGVLLKIVVADGEVDVGTTVAVIGAADEDVSALTAGTESGNGGGPSSPAVEAEAPKAEASQTDAPQAEAREAEAPGAEAPAEPEAAEAPKAEAAPAEAPQAEAPQADGTADMQEREAAPQAEEVKPAEVVSAPASTAPRAEGERVKASPLARRIARERGVDLAAVAGTGPDGRVIADDVEKAAAAPAPPVAVEAPAEEAVAPEAVPEPAPAAAPEEPEAPPEPAPKEVEVVELTSTRRTIARRLTEAWEAPVFQLTVTADASELVATRETMVELLREGEVKPTVSDVLTRIAASALMRHRPVNAHFVDGKIHRFPTANVGIAVAAPGGLVVPVIRDANQKSVQQIAVDRADLVSRARDGKLQLADLESGTFTISNLGMFGIEQFVAVLNPPQVAILAVGSIEDRPRAVEGELVVRPTITMTLTCDHRAIDGSEGAEFLRTVKTFVESPALAL